MSALDPPFTSVSGWSRHAARKSHQIFCTVHEGRQFASWCGTGRLLSTRFSIGLSGRGDQGGDDWFDGPSARHLGPELRAAAFSPSCARRDHQLQRLRQESRPEGLRLRDSRCSMPSTSRRPSVLSPPPPSRDRHDPPRLAHLHARPATGTASRPWAGGRRARICPSRSHPSPAGSTDASTHVGPSREPPSEEAHSALGCRSTVPVARHQALAALLADASPAPRRRSPQS